MSEQQRYTSSGRYHHPVGGTASRKEVRSQHRLRSFFLEKPTLGFLCPCQLKLALPTLLYFIDDCFGLLLHFFDVSRSALLYDNSANGIAWQLLKVLSFLHGYIQFDTAHKMPSQVVTILRARMLNDAVSAQPNYVQSRSVRSRAQRRRKQPAVYHKQYHLKIHSYGMDTTSFLRFILSPQSTRNVFPYIDFVAKMAWQYGPVVIELFSLIHMSSLSAS